MAAGAQPSVFEYRRSGYLLSTDPRRVDVPYVHAVLKEAPWSAGISRDVLDRGMENSLAFGLYIDGKQVGFARVVTDRATFALLTDVFVDESYRGKGLSRIIMEGVTSHPALQGLRRFLLVTKDAHGLYNKFGFCWRTLTASWSAPGRRPAWTSTNTNSPELRELFNGAGA